MWGDSKYRLLLLWMSKLDCSSDDGVLREDRSILASNLTATSVDQLPHRQVYTHEGIPYSTALFTVNSGW